MKYAKVFTVVSLAVLSVVFLGALFWTSGNLDERDGANLSNVKITPNQGWKEVYEDTGLIRYRFLLQNLSNKAVSIERVVAQCGCTAVAVGQDVIEPGGQTELYVDYTIAGVIGKLPLRTVSIFTDRDNRPHQVTVGGKRRKRYVIDPAIIDVGVIDAGPVWRDVSIRVVGASEDGVALLAERAFADHPWVNVQQVSAEPQDNGDLVYQLRVKVDPPVGDFKTTVFVPWRRNNGNGATIPVKGSLPPPMSIDPSVAFFGVVSPGQTVEATLKLHSRVGELSSSDARVTANGTLSGLEIWPDNADRSVIHLKWTVPTNLEGPVNGRAMIDAELDGDSIRTNVKVIAFVSKETGSAQAKEVLAIP